jgi:hypothetical protein
MLDQSPIQVVRTKIEQESMSAIYIEGIIAGVIGAGISQPGFLAGTADLARREGDRVSNKFRPAIGS